METTEPIEVEGWLRQAAFVRSLARDLVAGAHDADDLAQEAWLRALRVGPRAGWSWRAWLAGLVRNVARERHRADGRRAAHERAAAPREASDGGDPAELAARLDLIRRALAEVARLDERERATVLRHYLDGDSLAEIARRGGEPEATVRSRLRRALERLRARLDGDAAGGRAAWLAAFAPWAGGGAEVMRVPAAPHAPLSPVAPTAKFAAIAAAIVVTGSAAWWVIEGGADRAADGARLAANEGAHASDASLPPFPLPVVAERVAATAGDQAADGASDSVEVPSPSSSEAQAATWRVVGRVVGLDPAIACASPVVVEPLATIEANLSDAQRAALACAAPLDDEGRFVVTLAPLTPAATGSVGRPHWRGLRVALADPRYVDVEEFVPVADATGAQYDAPHDFAVDLATRPSALAHGRVVDETGAPVADATVGWSEWDDGDGEARRVTTDEAGLFEIEASAVGPRRLSASGGSVDGGGSFSSDGALNARLAEFLACETTVALLAGHDVSAGELVLRRGIAIRGRALGRDGAPLPFARIVGHARVAVPTPEHPLNEEWCERVAIAADDGSFTLAGLVAGIWKVRIEEARGEKCHAVTFDDNERGLVVVEAPAEGVELTLATIRVEALLCLDGQPQPGLPLMVHGTTPDRRNSSDLGMTSDADGRIAFAGAPGCTFQLFFDRADLEQAAPPFTLRDDATLHRVTLDLERRRPRPSLAIRFADEGADRVERACLWLEPADGSWPNPAEKRVAPDGEGVCWWRDIDPGDWRVTVVPGGGSFGVGGCFEAETFEVELREPIAHERTIALRTTGRLTLFARDGAGAGVRATCEVVPLGEGPPLPVHFACETAFGARSSIRTTFDDWPAFVVPPPSPGRWRLRFTCDGFVPQEVEAEVRPFETTEVVVTLARR